jgi:hypothetical protein
LLSLDLLLEVIAIGAKSKGSRIRGQPAQGLLQQSFDAGGG